VGEDTFAHAPAVGGVGVFPVERGDVDSGLGDELGVNELGDVGDALHSVDRVGGRKEERA
jgi:hypothetical protein